MKASTFIRARAWAPFVLLSSALAALCLDSNLLSGLLALFCPGGALYPRASLSRLVAEHLVLSLVSGFFSALVGVTAGIVATRRGEGTFALVADRLASVAQTIPPAAVLALAVPSLGFGFYPTIAALFLYGILPILRNTMSGLSGVDAGTLEAARGMGMGSALVLRKVELPLASPVILAGLRSSMVVNVGTAAIGATIGAGGLGAPIVSGLVTQNPSYLIEGSLAVSLLALSLDAFFSGLSTRISGTRAKER